MPRTGGPACGNTAARKAAQAAASTVAQQQKKAMQDRAGAASLRQAGAARAEAALREDPARQDAAIAAVAGCGEDVVRGVRENLQASGEIPGGRQAGPYRGRCLAGDEVPGGRLQVWPAGRHAPTPDSCTGMLAGCNGTGATSGRQLPGSPRS